MKITQLTGKQLERVKRNIEHAKTHRPGGLLIAEQKALAGVITELERRADIECRCPECGHKISRALGNGHKLSHYKKCSLYEKAYG